jgi:plastocyanin
MGTNRSLVTLTFYMSSIAIPKRLAPAFVLAGSAYFFAGLSGATAATVTVDIINYAYTPDPITINVNDTVNWIWEGDFHSTTAVDGLWDSGVYNTGYSYSYTFTSAGSFPYYCTIHFFYGTVNVQAASVPPTVMITNPANGLVLSAPATLTLSATATDADASSASVQFFQGATALGTLASAPYSIVVSNLPAGNYTFSAVATDDNGLMATNSIAVQVVNPAPIMLAAPQRGPGAGFQFSYSAAVGLTYVVDRASLLPNWTALGTNKAATSVVLFQDSGATAGASYYRVRQMLDP